MTCESRRVLRYDGQTILLEGDGKYELGAYLGGGASGVVYEANHNGSKQRVAVKILHPLGFKTTRAALDRYNEITDPREEIRWFMHPQTRDVVVTGRDGKELGLLKCAEIWGMSLPVEDMTDSQVLESLRQGRRKGLVPPKYSRFLRQRALLFREIASMRRVSGHRNVLRLDEVLEHMQDSKLTFFLVLELASGGELFDRITADEGCDEGVARNYLNQLLDGVLYCHSRGVCHRDLKPENLLLTHDGDVLKIADFGLSAVMSNETLLGSASSSSNPLKADPLKRLVSIVGSCHYIAPEVLSKEAYDGTKADAWSIGVILYALLAGSLPFGKELLTCPRFLTFSKALKGTSSQANDRRFYCGDVDSVAALRAELDWFLPEKLTNEAVLLIIGLLNPDPSTRYTVKRALGDVWFRRYPSADSNILLEEDDVESSMLMMDVESDEGDDKKRNRDVMSHDGGEEADDVFEMEMDEDKPKFVPTPSKQIKPSVSASPGGGCRNDAGAVSASAYGAEVARSAPVAGRGSLSTASSSAAVAFSFTSPPLAPRQSVSPPLVVAGAAHSYTPGANPFMSIGRDTDGDASSEEGGSRRNSGLFTRRSIIGESSSRSRANSGRSATGNFRSRSSSPPPSRGGGAGREEAPIFHEAMKRSTIFTTCVPATQVLERLSKTVGEMGGLSCRINWERFQLEITQDESGLQLCLVQIFLSRERPGPVYIVEFVRGPEFEIFAFKHFYNQVAKQVATIVRADHTHTLRY